MTQARLNTLILSLGAVAVAILAFAVGAVLTHRDPPPAPVGPPVLADANAIPKAVAVAPIEIPKAAPAETKPAPVETRPALEAPTPIPLPEVPPLVLGNPPPAPPAPAPTLPTPAPAPPAADNPNKPDPATWNTKDNGPTVEQDGTAIHIKGISAQDGWNHWNGVETVKEYPEGDFTASVDFINPRFSGKDINDIGLTYLIASTAAGDRIGIFYRIRFGYRVQSWNPKATSDWLKPLGDEAFAFHTMTLQYEAATQTASGWIDDKPIGTVKATMKGKVTFALVTNTDKAGMNMDVRYDNFKATDKLHGKITPKPAPTPAAPPPALP